MVFSPSSGDGHCSDSTNGGAKAEAIRQDKQARGVLRGQALGRRDSESACQWETRPDGIDEAPQVETGAWCEVGEGRNEER